MGDSAIQSAVIGDLRVRRPGLEIVGICPEPEDTLATLGIPAFPLGGHGPQAPIRKGDPQRGPALRRIARFVRSLDLLIVSGGGQLDDFWGGAWAHPYSMFVWTLLARVQRVKVAFLGVGLDRLSSPLSRFFALSALRLAHYRAFRDKGTLERLRALGLRAPSVTCPDLAFALRVERAGEPSVACAPFVAINPVARATWSHEQDPRHDAYVRNLAVACEWIVERGLRLRIVCSQSAMDAEVARLLVRAIRAPYAEKVELREAARVLDFLAQVDGAQLVIASRLHGTILSLVAGSPVIAISPQRKVGQQMDDVGLGDYWIELQSFAAPDLIDRVRATLENGPSLRQCIRERTEAYRAALARTYDDVLALI